MKDGNYPKYEFHELDIWNQYKIRWRCAIYIFSEEIKSLVKQYLTFKLTFTTK